MFIGIDGGGTKTAFALLDDRGDVLAQVTGGSGYYPEVGLAQVERVIAAGTAELLQQAGVSLADIRYAFIGLPAYGEDSRLQPQLDQLPKSTLRDVPFRCGNDMVCSWAGSLACRDGISIVAGTGSIAYGRYAGREARAGGWGELFSDEGSAYWIAREGLNAFSRMSDGRLPASELYALMRTQLELPQDIELCALVYGDGAASRREFAKIARIVHDAATLGDAMAMSILQRAGEELAALVQAVYRSLAISPAQFAEQRIAVSYSGSVLERNARVLTSFTTALNSPIPCRIHAPITSPSIGAALYAGQLAGVLWSDAIVAKLASDDQSHD